eukprot:GHRQ01032200.1.p1 GENE.GHRQ01032200.1~~GHRQ01032200.1.p1  ORF type:complete len:117 (+),score=29.29 GHRQ01032200.1:425-775(+)
MRTTGPTAHLWGAALCVYRSSVSVGCKALCTAHQKMHYKNMPESRPQHAHLLGLSNASMAPKMPTKENRKMNKIAITPPVMKDLTMVRGSPRNARSAAMTAAAAAAAELEGTRHRS